MGENDLMRYKRCTVLGIVEVCIKLLLQSIITYITYIIITYITVTSEHYSHYIHILWIAIEKRNDYLQSWEARK